MKNFVLTSESVTEGHPDKLCDQVSDAVVDAYLTAGSRAGVIAECAVSSGVMFLSVRAGQEAPVDLASLARRMMAEVGYPDSAPTVMLDLSVSPDLTPEALAPDRARHMVSAFGYACAGSTTAMPYPIEAAHRIVAAIDLARREGRVPWIAPDAQAQVAARFENRAPVDLEAVALNFGHTATPPPEVMQRDLLKEVLRPALDFGPIGLTDDVRLIYLPAESPAGPGVHSGLTGRKSADDAYGSFVRRSGPSLCGKDPSRIDRIAAYAARQAARAVVTAELARECEVQLSYMIDDATPVTVEVDTYESGKLADSTLSNRLHQLFDFRPGAIAERMELWNQPAKHGGRFYTDLARYGQMGRDDVAPPWEEVDDLAKALA